MKLDLKPGYSGGLRLCGFPYPGFRFQFLDDPGFWFRFSDNLFRFSNEVKFFSNNKVCKQIFVFKIIKKTKFYPFKKWSDYNSDEFV